MNIVSDLLHRMWIVAFSFNGVCYSEQYVGVTAQQVVIILQVEWSVLE